MISEVPNIKISGINYPVYAADYTWGGANEPSTLSVVLVNKDGEYNAPDLGTENISKIKFGSFFNFNGYPVNFTESYSNKGRTLSITYKDTSTILDKVFVGLKGVHGPAPAPLNGVNLDGTTVYGSFDYKHMLLLGNYVDPCEGVEADYVDPCNPCVSTTEFQSVAESTSKKFIDCQTARFTQILDVTYSFQELIAGLRTKGIVFANVPPIKNTFYGRYSGSAREVLKSWCNDLGFTFFWENDKITFVDLKTGIDINDADFYTTCSLIEYSNSESIEDNVAISNIVYFGAEGRLDTYDCANADYKLTLIPITLKDIFWAEGRTGPALQPYISKYYTLPATGPNSVVGLQVACLMNSQSQMLRDMVLLYEYYQTPTISVLDNQEFPLLGLTVMKTWDVKTTSGGTADTALQKSLKEEFYKLPSSVIAAAIKHGASMCKIKWDREKYQKFSEFERKLAQEFIGRYWISFFSKGDRFNYSAPDGNVEYYDAGTPALLPFIDVIPQSSIAASNFLQFMINDSAALNKDSGHVGDVTTANPNSFAHSFLLMDRNPSWEPTSTNEDVIKFSEIFKDRYFLNIEPFKLEGGADEFLEDEFFALIFDKPNTFNFTDAGIVAHPIEEGNKNRTVEIGGYTTTYGLRSSLCQKYNLEVGDEGDSNTPEWNGNLSFFLPAQAHKDFGVDFAGYTIVASNQNSSSQTNVFVPRKEVIFGDMETPASDAVAMSVNFKDITSLIQSIIQQDGSSCSYSTSAIQEIINDYYVNTKRTKSIRRIQKSYSLGGFPTRVLKLEDGLASFSVRYSSEGGISTSVEFSNSPPIVKSETVQDKEFELHILKRILRKKRLSSQDKITL